ncbi:MAG: AI-2E family transporter [Bacteroidales bacterium]|nr:AI-2E family transporter [Bacteroidales bacterium]
MNFIQRRLPLIIAILLVGASLYYFTTIWIYVVVAAIISLIGRRPSRWVSNAKIGRFKVSPAIGSALTLLVFWLLFFTFLRLFVPLIVNEANTLSSVNVSAIQQAFQEPIAQVEAWFGKLRVNQSTSDIKQSFWNAINTVLSLEHIKTVFSNLIGAVGDIVIAIFAISFLSFFFMKDEKLLMRGILSVFAVEKEEQVKKVVLTIVKLLSRYFSGLLLEVFAVISLVTIGLMIVGIGFSHAIVIGLVAGFLNVIPYVGPIIGMAFGSIIAIATELTNEVPDNLGLLVLGVVAVFIIVQLIDNIVLQPIIYSNSVNASPLEIFLVILMAGTIGGIIGMVLAIPLYTIFRVILKEVFGHYKFVQSITKNI